MKLILLCCIILIGALAAKVWFSHEPSTEPQLQNEAPEPIEAPTIVEALPAEPEPDTPIVTVEPVVAPVVLLYTQQILAVSFLK